MSILKAFESLLPAKPYYCDETGYLKIAGRNLARSAAHVQFNGPTHKHWLVFDIDRSDTYDLLQDPHIPAPNILTINPANGHGHAFYLLETPVRTAENGSARALRYAAAVERALRERLGGDKGYAGLVAKNPLHPHWCTFTPRQQPYSLGELADFFTKKELNKRDDPKKRDGLWRNVDTFNELREWAYKAIRQFDRSQGYERWHTAVFERCAALQLQFDNPLAVSEYKAIAKSVAKWVYTRLGKNGHSSAFIEKQRERGKRGGQAKSMSYEPKREQALVMRRSGMTIRSIADQLGVSDKSIKRWTQSERGQWPKSDNSPQGAFLGV